MKRSVELTKEEEIGKSQKPKKLIKKTREEEIKIYEEEIEKVKARYLKRTSPLNIKIYRERRNLANRAYWLNKIEETVNQLIYLYSALDGYGEIGIIKTDATLLFEKYDQKIDFNGTDEENITQLKKEATQDEILSAINKFKDQYKEYIPFLHDYTDEEYKESELEDMNMYTKSYQEQLRILLNTF